MTQTIRKNAGHRLQPQQAVLPELSQLVSDGILIGAPRAISLEQNRQFPLVEVNLRCESLPVKSASQFMHAQGHTHVVWRVGIDKFHVKEKFQSKEWELFLALFLDEHAATHTLVLSYGWEVEYSHTILDSIDTLQNSAPFAIVVDAEHYSWKTPRVQQTMQSLKLQQVFLDRPCLPGLVKDINYHTGSVAILRCIGRNRKDWFEQSVDERFAYRYSPIEIREIGDRILALREHHERILVSFCNRPASNTFENAVQLARDLQKRILP